MALNPIPPRVPFVDAEGRLTPEAYRFFQQIFERIGGHEGMGAEDLAILASTVAQTGAAQAQAIQDVEAAMPVDLSGQIAGLIAEVRDLRQQAGQVESVRAELAEVQKAMAGVELQATFRDPFRVDWERPGKIGSLTASTGVFTSVNKVVITAPANSATLTIADGKTFTASNTLTLTATDGATLAVGGGGTLGSAAYAATGDFAARSSTALAPVATDPASTQTLANSLRSVLISVGIGT